MRSLEAIQTLYRQFSHIEDAKKATEAAATTYGAALVDVQPDALEKKKAKLQTMAAVMPHPHFADFVAVLARGAGAPPVVDDRGAPIRPPEARMLTGETPEERLVRLLDLPGFALDMVCQAVGGKGEFEPAVMARVRWFLAGELRQAGASNTARRLVDKLLVSGRVSHADLTRCVAWFDATNAYVDLTAVVQSLAELAAAWLDARDRNTLTPQALNATVPPQHESAQRLLWWLYLLDPDNLHILDEDRRMEAELVAWLADVEPQLEREKARMRLAGNLAQWYAGFQPDKLDQHIDGLPLAPEEKRAARGYFLLCWQVSEWVDNILPRARALAVQETLSRRNRKLAKQPDNTQLLLERAQLLRLSGEREKALADLTRLRTLQPDAAHCLSEALVLHELGRMREVEVAASRGLRGAAPRDAATGGLYTLRASARLHQGKILEAFGDLQKGLMLGDTPDLWRLRLQLVAADAKACGKALQGAEKRPPAPEFFALERARAALLHRSAFAEAIAEYDAALRLNESSEPARRGKALAQELLHFSQNLPTPVVDEASPEDEQALLQALMGGLTPPGAAPAAR